MAEKKTTAVDTAENVVEVKKEQLDEILKGYEDMKNQVALLTKQAADNEALRSSEGNRQDEEKRLLELVKEANAKSEELVNLHIDSGAIRSNKNAEVSINGVQTIIPKGETVKVKKSLKEVIDNSLNQKNIARGLQEERNSEYKTAEAEGAFRA